MGCIDLREWIALLEREGELHRITAQVDWDCEIGTVRIEMIWALAGTTHDTNTTAPNGMARFSMLDLARELGSDLITSVPAPSSPVARSGMIRRLSLPPCDADHSAGVLVS